MRHTPLSLSSSSSKKPLTQVGSGEWHRRAESAPLEPPGARPEVQASGPGASFHFERYAGRRALSSQTRRAWPAHVTLTGPGGWRRLQSDATPPAHPIRHGWMGSSTTWTSTTLSFPSRGPRGRLKWICSQALRRCPYRSAWSSPASTRSARPRSCRPSWGEHLPSPKPVPRHLETPASGCCPIPGIMPPLWTFWARCIQQE